jgi:putative transposase
MPFYRQRKIRLPAERYRGRHTYFVTICTEQRRPVFTERPEGHWVLEHLREYAARASFCLHAFCAMPDHVHFRAEGTTDTCDLTPFAEGFKQRTGFEYRSRSGAMLWQKRFHDYVLRDTDAIEDIACYIWMNPVRKGLCAKPEEYPLSGSHTIEWIKRVTCRAQWSPPWHIRSSGVT